MRAPPDLLERPYLRPVYDEPEFVVRTVWRLYGGWYDGNPAHLKPAPDAALAARAGGAGRRARGCWPTGPQALAAPATCAWPATWPSWPPRPRPTTPASTGSRAEVFARRAGEELSTMSKGVFSWAADESQARLGEMGD